MADRDLIASWRREEATPFSGWDFGHIDGRMVDEGSPWSYRALAREALRAVGSAVDLGTGGGERIGSLADAFPRLMVATEGYAPSVTIAAKRLIPLGADVVAYGPDPARPRPSALQDDAPPLPFQDGSFDLILDRHEAYDANEVARVLAPGGIFLTQQVDGRSYADLVGRFGSSPQFPGITLANLVGELERAGLSIDDARSWWGSLEFRDVGALVYYLKAAPWMVPGFSVDRFEAVLLQLQRDLEIAGSLRFGAGRLLIKAHKPLRPPS